MLSMLPSSLLSPLVPPVDDALLYAVAPVADAGRCGGSERRVAAVRTRPSTSRRWWVFPVGPPDDLRRVASFLRR